MILPVHRNLSYTELEGLDLLLGQTSYQTWGQEGTFLSSQTGKGLWVFFSLHLC